MKQALELWEAATAKTVGATLKKWDSGNIKNSVAKRPGLSSN
jgi:hypothetical protein